MLRAKDEAELMSKHPNDPHKLILLQKPSREMSVAQLVQFVQMMFAAILAARKVTAVHYWWAGEALKMTRAKLGIKRGDWIEYVVKELRLNWPMVRTAQRIRKKNANPDKCTGKTLRQAEAYKPRRAKGNDRDQQGNNGAIGKRSDRPKQVGIHRFSEDAIAPWF